MISIHEYDLKPSRGLFWMSIKDGADPAAFEAYLRAPLVT